MSRLYLDHHLHKQPTPHGAFPYSTMADTCKQSANLPDGRFVYLRSKYRGPVRGMRGKNVAGRCSKSINIKAGRKQIPMNPPPLFLPTDGNTWPENAPNQDNLGRNLPSGFLSTSLHDLPSAIPGASQDSAEPGK